MKTWVAFCAVAFGAISSPAFAQSGAEPTIVYGEPEPSSHAPIPSATTPPSVDNGIADGIVKHAGSPSVGNGIANGVVKWRGSPSVDDGVADGVAITPFMEQHSR